MLNPIEEIKNRLDIVEVIGGYLKLKKAGANFQALCPFHSEKKPSFFVSPSRQIWRCFGCSKGGDVFAFIKEIEGVEFGDALRMLAQRAGVELKREDPRLTTQRERLYEICELACQFFEKQLEQSKTGKQVQEYLFKRGIQKESQNNWRLGYAPETWQGLNEFLGNRGFKEEEIIKAGLAIRNERGNFYDRFRARIMFPIFDLNSQIVGFTGRVTEEAELRKTAVDNTGNGTKRVGDNVSRGPASTSGNIGSGMAKYVNTPATILYDKSRILYGLDRAKLDIRTQKGCILVEGNVDVILSHQAGIKNVVATCGTALTLYQLDTLRRYSDNLFLAFDMDIAGDSATKRGISLAQEKGFDIKIVVLPEGKDPADVISQNVEGWKKFLQESKTILDFYFDNAFSRFDNKTSDGKREISKILLPVLRRIPNKIVQSYWIQKLASDLKAREEDIREELNKTKIEPSWLIKEPGSPVVSKNKAELLEERILMLALNHPEKIAMFKEGDFEFFSPQTVEILAGLQKWGISHDGLKEKLSQAMFEKIQMLNLENEIREQEIDFNEEFEKCFNSLRCFKVKEKLQELSKSIKQAETEKNIQQVKILTNQFKDLAQKIKI